jgi:murein DD-endopeptidase MepM/ murein hydrolase activator NlpD
MGTSLPNAMELTPGLARDGALKGLQNQLKTLHDTAATLNPEEKARYRAELREAAEGFEAMMLNELLKEMMPENEEGLFGKGLGSSTYHQLFLTELSTLLASTRQLGLADLIERDVAQRVGLTDESESRTEPIPGQALGRPLPQISRNGHYGWQRYFGSDSSRTSGMESAMRRHYESAMPVPRFMKPLEGSLSSEYGVRKDPFTEELRHHSGIDIAAPEGSDIKASAAGTVTFSGRQQGYGNLVIIEHAGDFETWYAHNADILVREGETVEAGQVVAKVGNTGRSTGPHLHFEIRRNDELCDPEELMECAD